MDWDERIREAAALFERGDNGPALAIFDELAGDETGDKFARAMMCLNIATIEAKQGSKIRVMKAYERAAGLAIYAYLMVQEKRITWLLESGQAQQAAEVIDDILRIKELAAADRAALEARLREARKLAG